MTQSPLVLLGDRSSDQAAEIAALFELGLCSQSQIVDGADRMIAALPAPPIEIIDLSLSKPGSDRIPELLEQAGASAAPTAMRPALLELSRRLDARQIGLRDAIARMEHFAWRHPAVVGSEMEDFLRGADDVYELIKQGIQVSTPTHNQLRSDFEEQLNRAATA